MNEQIDSQSLLYLVCTSHYIDTSWCKFLINKGASLYRGKSAFQSLCEKSSSCYLKIEICRNALIKELSETFKYTDYDKFKHQVIESIEKEEVIVVELDHLKALDHFSLKKEEEN